MKSYFKFGLVICVVAFSISAFAGSVSNFNYTTTLSGVSDTTVNAKFSYNKSTDTFSNVSLAFQGNSIFNGLSGTLPQEQGDTFVFDKTVNGYTVSYTIVFNPLTGTYTAYGSISKGRSDGSFQYNSTPEGGTQLSYLAASGLALFAGIFLAGKQRRQPAEN